MRGHARTGEAPRGPYKYHFYGGPSACSWVCTRERPWLQACARAPIRVQAMRRGTDAWGKAGFQKSFAENEIWRDVTISVMISGYVTAFVAQRYAILRSQRNRFQKSIVAQIRIVSSVARNMVPDTRAHHADGCSRSINSVRENYMPHTDVFLCSRSTQFQPAQRKKLCIRTSRCVARAACMRGRPDCAHASADRAVRVLTSSMSAPKSGSG